MKEKCRIMMKKWQKSETNVGLTEEKSDGKGTDNVEDKCGKSEGEGLKNEGKSKEK